MSSQPIPAVAIIANSFTPYRAHLHRRIVRELKQIQLFSVFTHELSAFPWAANTEAEIRPIIFGPGERAEAQAQFSHALHEWKKGGRIIRWLKENRIAAVLLLGYNDPGRLRIWRWCVKHRVPIILWGDSNIHGDWARGVRGFVKRQVLSRLVRGSDAVMPCGSFGAQYFRKYGAVDRKIFLMPYEPDYQLIAQIDSSQIAQALERFHLDPQRRRIVYSGRLVPVKRVDLLIDAFVQIAPQRNEWDLLIIGDGAQRDFLKQRIPEQLKQRVKWTGFLDDQQTVSALYRGSDALVLPSDYEPWALVINEAVAAGLAIVSSNVVGAAAELVRDGVNGRVFPANNLQALTNSLLDVTAANRINAMKAASPMILQDWRRVADPVDGLRQALISAGVIRRDPLPSDSGVSAELSCNHPT
ncbi:MAG TPA: glycosyltransferase family 4 protein [Tepidisphaeraceae bacterium]|nr:glycosyltransferase family 4 protein [Tepidisphaeraceae bacterium]